MTTPAQEFATFLETAGLGVKGAASGWGIYVGREPSRPDQAITCFDTGGFDANPKWSQDQSTVQVRIRGARGDYVGTHAKALAVKDELLGKANVTVGGVKYVGIWAVGDIIHIGYDENDRPLFTTNWRAVREPPASGNRAALG